MLVGGGNVLGKAVSSSGLLGYLSDAITLGNKFSMFRVLCLIVLILQPCLLIILFLR
jgi:hypothetical protein